MSDLVASYYDDGNFNVAQQNGAPVLSFPFAEQGDLQSFEYAVTMRMDIDHYKRPTLMSVRKFPLGMAYLVDVSNPVMVGQRLNEWTETWACVPVNRNEYGSTNYNYQRVVRYRTSPLLILSTVAKISEYNDIFSGRYFYEYSIGPLPDLAMTRAWPVVRKVVVGPLTTIINDVQFTGDNIVTAAGEVLAQNTITRRYKGEIFERQSIFVKPIVQRLPAEDADLNAFSFIAGRVLVSG